LMSLWRDETDVRYNHIFVVNADGSGAARSGRLQTELFLRRDGRHQR
jgi:hypothetical protein